MTAGIKSHSSTGKEESERDSGQDKGMHAFLVPSLGVPPLSLLCQLNKHVCMPSVLCLGS